MKMVLITRIRTACMTLAGGRGDIRSNTNRKKKRVYPFSLYRDELNQETL